MRAHLHRQCGKPVLRFAPQVRRPSGLPAFVAGMVFATTVISIALYTASRPAERPPEPAPARRPAPAVDFRETEPELPLPEPGNTDEGHLAGWSSNSFPSRAASCAR